jgi:hypothetical protein
MKKSDWLKGKKAERPKEVSVDVTNKKQKHERMKRPMTYLSGPVYYVNQNR